MDYSSRHSECLYTVLMTASTFPASATDPVPRFVLDQALTMAEQSRGLKIVVLTPHTPVSHSRQWPQNESEDGRVVQYRFHYAPRRLETLTAYGIMPALSANPARVFLVPGLFIAQFFALWKLARRVRPNVIYAHWFTPQALTAKAVSILTGIPFGFTTHASDVAVWSRLGCVGRKVVSSVTKDAAFVSAVSTQTASKLLDFFPAGGRRNAVKGRLAIIPMGVTVPPGPIEDGNPRHAFIIARLVEKKGLQVLLEAWPLVTKKVPDAVLTIAGKGPLEGELRAQAVKRGLDIRFPGYVTGAAKEQVFQDGGVVLQPSVVAETGDSDGLPVALLEGLARGRIAVASDASGAQDLLVDGTSGYLVPAGNADELAQAIVKAMLLCPRQRAQMAVRARAQVSTLSWPRMAAKQLSLFPGIAPHAEPDGQH